MAWWVSVPAGDIPLSRGLPQVPLPRRVAGDLRHSHLGRAAQCGPAHTEACPGQSVTLINFELKTLISKKFEWSDFERHFTAGPSGTSRLRVSRPLSNLLPRQNYSQMLAKNSQTSYCGS